MTRIPLSHLFGDNGNQQPYIAPNGRHIVYNLKRKGQYDIAIGALHQDAKADAAENTFLVGDSVKLFNKHRPLDFLTWLPRNDGILFSQHNGDEDHSLIRVDLDLDAKTPIVGRSVNLTPGNDNRSEFLSFDEHDDDRCFATQHSDGLANVHAIDIRSGEHQIVAKNPGDVFRWKIDDKLIALSMGEDSRVFVKVGNLTGDPDWKTMAESKPGDTLYPFGFDETHDKLLTLSQQDGNTDAILAYSSPSAYDVIAKDDVFDIANIGRHPITGKLEWVENSMRGIRTNIAVEVEDDVKALNERFGTTWDLISRDKNDRLWTICDKNSATAGEYYLYDRNSHKFTFLFSARPELNAYTLSSVKQVEFPSKDDAIIHGFISFPTDHDLSKPCPMVVQAHGGPWIHYKGKFDPEVQRFNNLGYAVLQVNYRGSTGYGKAFVDSGDREMGGKMQDDLYAARDWAVQEGYADPENIAIMGRSAGGYMVLQALTDQSDKFTCGVDIMGPSHLPSLIESTVKEYPSTAPELHKRVGHPEIDKQMLLERSPSERLQNLKVPLFIAHGALDKRVPVQHARAVANAVEHNRAQVSYIEFSDEGHTIEISSNLHRLHTELEQFLAQNLRSNA